MRGPVRGLTNITFITHSLSLFGYIYSTLNMGKCQAFLNKIVNRFIVLKYGLRPLLTHQTGAIWMGLEPTTSTVTG